MYIITYENGDWDKDLVTGECVYKDLVEEYKNKDFIMALQEFLTAIEDVYEPTNRVSLTWVPKKKGKQ